LKVESNNPKPSRPGINNSVSGI